MKVKIVNQIEKIEFYSQLIPTILELRIMKKREDVYFVKI